MRFRRVVAPRSGDRHSRSRGQSVVELALVAPVLLLMLLITIDFGRLFLSYVTLNNVTRVAANYGALAPEAFTGTPSTAAYDAAVGREATGLNCDLRPDAGGHNPPIPTYPNGTQLGGTSVAAMTCDFSLLTPLISSFFGATLPISAEAQFPVRTGAIANIGGTITLPPPGGAVADFAFTGVTGGTIDGLGNVTGTPPVTVNVNDLSNNAQTWDWDWGDGSTPHDTGPAPPAHSYTSAGTFTVTLVVTNTQGSSSRSRTVSTTPSATPPPVAGFYGTPQGSPPQAQGGGAGGDVISGTRSLVVDFTNTSTGANAYSWDFGDGGGPSTDPSPQHTYTSLGIYDVVMTITDPAGGGGLTRSSYVSVGCLGPNFSDTSITTANADATWVAAGFTGSTTYKAAGANGNGTPNPPNGAKAIISQEGVQGGQLYAPTKKNNQPWGCDYDVTLVYTP